MKMKEIKNKKNSPTDDFSLLSQPTESEEKLASRFSVSAKTQSAPAHLRDGSAVG